jgi:TonB-dependent SusC/RagA subfamily outer membrane receptor
MADTPPLERVVTLDLRDVTLESALEEINRQATLGLTYTPRVVPVNRKVTIQKRSISVREALAVVLSSTGVIAVVTEGRTVMLVRQDGAEAPAAPGAVYGTVVDSATGDPVAHVLVTVKGTTLRASTTDRGQYQISNVPPGSQIIVTRLLGYQPIERDVTVAEDRRARADFALQHGLTRLQEVVTTATGPQRRLELGNDITVINADSIVRTEPISSVTDLLETRVPGLTVQRTSGVPGDPARLRLRGAGSLLLNNDPIVIVDGIRIYAAQSDVRGGNLANRNAAATDGYAAPSPLDYMDPHSIETIEVLKGPSAATLYGQDAANGVIVISTKKGRAGPPRWEVSVDQGRTAMAGSYPDLLLRWGHRDISNIAVICPITDTRCQGDSVVTFQLLNDPDLTILDHGRTGAVFLGVSGGSNTLTYAINGNYRNEVGLVTLPKFEVERFRLNEGTSPPGWMKRPQNFTHWGGTSRLTANLGTRADVSLTAGLARLSRQHSRMEDQLGPLMTTYLDRTTGTYYRASGGGVSLDPPAASLFIDYYERARETVTSFTNSISASWRPRTWLTSTADIGLNVDQRGDETLLPRGLGLTGDTLGRLGIGNGTSMVSTVKLRTSTRVPIGKGFELGFATGVDYTGQSIADLISQEPGGRHRFGERCGRDHKPHRASDAPSNLRLVRGAIAQRRATLRYRRTPTRWRQHLRDSRAGAGFPKAQCLICDF